jgi:hypothetical protein
MLQDLATAMAFEYHKERNRGKEVLQYMERREI